MVDYIKTVVSDIQQEEIDRNIMLHAYDDNDILEIFPVSELAKFVEKSDKILGKDYNIRRHRIFISDKKILEINEKAQKDTEQLLKSSSTDNFNRMHKLVEDLGGDYKKALNSICFEKGRIMWVELKVEDSFLSGLITGWLFTKSNYNKELGEEKPMYALGCSVQQIMFSKPSGYSDEEKAAIKKLYESAFGQDTHI